MSVTIRRWYFALNAQAPDFYKEMAQAAVISAYMNTDLQPVLLYDGVADTFTSLMESLGVAVVRVQSRFKDLFFSVKKNSVGKPFSSRFASGSFLRFEIAHLEPEEPYVLYTDVDVIFLKEVNPFPVSPNLFACAPEIFIDDYSHLNSGVMVINVPHFQKSISEIESYIKENIIEQGFYDQGALNRLYNGKWDKLPPEYNWKPYWGVNGKAKILHFHGPKPKDISKLLQQKLDINNQFSRLMDKSRCAYHQYNVLYNEVVKYIADAPKLASRQNQA